MSSAPYTLWAIVLIFSTIDIYRKDSASNAGEHTTALHSKGSKEIRFGEVNTYQRDIRIKHSSAK